MPGLLLGPGDVTFVKLSRAAIRRLFGRFLSSTQDAHGEDRRSSSASVRRRADSGTQGTRGGAEASRHVHRLDERARAAPPRLRDRGQLDRRGAGRLLRHHHGDHPRGRLDHRGRQRARHPRGHARGGEDARGGGRAHRAPRRRQVRQGQLQGVRRAARRGRERGERALRAAQGVGEARGQAALHRLRPRRHHDQAQGARPGGEAGDGDDRLVQAGPDDLHRAAVRLRYAVGAPARALLPQQGRLHHPRRRARGAGEARDVPRRGRAEGDGAVPERPEEAAAPAGHLHRDRAGRHRDRARDAVQRRLQRERLLVREQHQHARGGDAPHGVQERPHARDQPVHQGLEQPLQEGQGDDALRRRRARGAHGGAQRQGARAAVRGADEDEARQLGGGGRGQERGAGAPVAVPAGEPEGRQHGHRQGDVRRARARRRARRAT